MSLSRQLDELINTSPADIVGSIEHWSSASGVDMHAHARHQLMFAKKGVTHVVTAQGSWILPPTRAIWISSGTQHSFKTSRPVDVVILYIAPDAPALPDWHGCTVVNVSPLVRELISACAVQNWDDGPQSPAGRLSHVLLDQLASLTQAPLALPEPVEPRALAVANLLKKDPTDQRTVEELASIVGASGRTIQRRFLAETGMSFSVWRVRQRMIVALEYLAYGDSVGTVASAVGYESSSSFAVAFRQAFGTSPSRYFDGFVPAMEVDGVSRTGIDFDVGVPALSATLSSGTSELVSG